MIEPALSTSTPPPEEDVTTTLYRAAIGPVSNGYYLPIFTRFEAADHAGISWNMAASLLTLNWLVFRKLWVAALAYVGILVAIALLVFGIGHLVFQFSDTLLMALGLGFGLAAFVLPGLFGNALFHTECRKTMAKALTGHSNVADARDALLRQASSHKRMFALAAANAVVLLLAVFAYQQFSALSHVAVLPHGALDAGNVAVGRAADTASPAPAVVPAASMASVAVSQPASSPASAAVSPAASAPVSIPVSIPASAPASTPASAPASAPAAVKASVAASAAVSLPASAPASVAVAASEPKPAAPAQPVSVPRPAAAVAKAPKAKHAAIASAAAAVPASAPASKATKAKADTKRQVASAPSTDTAAAKSFFINVGLFAVPENAAKAHAKLLEAGLPSVMKELKAKTRQIRVRVGPYGSQAQADAAAEKIRALQLEASIIQL